jgi:hypothetical protein
VSWFQNLFDARRKIAAWRKEYNEERPHSSLQYRTPAEFARATQIGGGKVENDNPVSIPTALTNFFKPLASRFRTTVQDWTDPLK